MKRALVMGGGGPACGLQIGALRAFAEAGIEFDVVSLSCIGAWVGLIMHQFEGTPTERVKQTYYFFREVFQKDDVHTMHPANAAFAPDLRKNALAMFDHITAPETWRNAWLPREMFDTGRATLALMRDPHRWTEGDLNIMALRWMGAHPLMRLASSSIYRTQNNGLARIYYPDSSFLTKLKFNRLLRTDRPLIYHNAWNLTKHRLDYFTNRIDDYQIIDMQTLCACSALPYIFAPIEINGDMYCEGAMHRPIDFDPLVNHPDLDEVWSLPIVDMAQVRAPTDMTGAIGNLPMMPAGSHGADLAEKFRRDNKKVKFIEVPPSTKINFDWSHSNLNLGCTEGYRATKEIIKAIKDTACPERW